MEVMVSDQASRVAARYLAMNDRTLHPTVVEYGVREMMKGKSPQVAARNTAKKLGGHPNMLLGSPTEPVAIDPRRLEEALFERIVGLAKENLARFKPGAEAMAVGAAVDHFRQKSRVEKAVRKRLGLR